MVRPVCVHRRPALALAGCALVLGAGTATALARGAGHHGATTAVARRALVTERGVRRQFATEPRGLAQLRRGTTTATTTAGRSTTTTATVAATTTATVAPPTTGATDPTDEVLFSTTYPAAGDADDAPGTGWTAVQYPSDEGVPQPTRIEFGPAPGSPTDPNLPTTNVACFQLEPYSIPPGTANGDVTDSNGDLTNRVEVYGRAAGHHPAADWPDPVGSIRWYSFSIYVPPGFPTSTKSSQWFLFTQWKGWATGSPPVDMAIEGNQFYLGGKHANEKLGPIDPGSWTHFIVGLDFSGSAATGWATVYVDGALVVDQAAVQTMNTYWSNGTKVVDPNYLKMGIYRSVTWHVPQVIYLSPMTIGTTLASVS